MTLVFELINGMKLGIEHVSGDEDDDWNYAIVIDFLLFRLGFFSNREEE